MTDQAQSSSQAVNVLSETEIRQKYRNCPAANTPSTINDSQLAIIRSQFQIPLQYELRVPLPHEKIYWRFEGGWFRVPTITLKYGVRFPLYSFITDFLSVIGIGFSQLAPNSFIHLICFFAHCKELDIELALDLFFCFFKLTNSKESGFKVLS